MSEVDNEAVGAFKLVQQTITNLRAEYAELSTKIEILSAEIKALPVKPVPFEDLKAGILDLIDAAGARYAEDSIKPALKEIATGHALGLQVYGEESRIGKPVTYKQLIGAINGEVFPMAFARIIQRREEDNNGSFYFFFGAQIKDGLKKVMDTMEPSDFGYASIHPDKVGTDRATRMAGIEVKETELKDLCHRRGEISTQLLQLGVRP